MKFKMLFITVSLFTICTSLFAKPVIDSVGVKNSDGKKLILFKVKAKDTYYSIGRRYHIQPEALMKFNGKKKAALSIGAIVEVPTDIPYKKSHKETETMEKVSKSEKVGNETKKEKKARLAREAAEARDEKKYKHINDKAADQAQDQTPPERVVQQPVQQQAPQPAQDNTPPTQYKVSAGETLYAISKRFNTTVDDITRLNNLTSTTLSPGQLLIVKSGEKATPEPPVATQVAAPVAHDSAAMMPNKDSSSLDHHLNANRYGLYEKNERGVATWMDDAGLDPNKKLVLHRTAPIGTVIKITNTMTNRTTFAKVVGSFTDTEATKDVIIIMTKNVADSLGALDKRFHVSISYGSPNE
jgi:LysM repeat protein